MWSHQPAGRPVTGTYKDGGVVKIKSLLTDRCVRCHQPEGDDEDAGKYRLDSYDGLLEHLKAGDLGPKAEAKP